MQLQDIKWLHVEPSTRCNAWCSGCGRNNFGYGLSGVKVTDLPVDKLSDTIAKLPSLETVQLCGVYGDPCAGKLIDKHIDVLAKAGVSVQLQTNGSLRTKKWWKELPDRLTNLEVWFALDGLEDTHSIYRQGTNWKKIIGNATSFIQAGGKAVWQFIPFKHNEHQIKDCMRMSAKLGFHRFEFIKNARYHEKAFDYRTGEPVKIAPWSGHLKQWERKGGLLHKNTLGIENNTVQTKDCMHLALKSLFLSALGRLTPCCYLEKTEHTSVDILSTIKQKNYIPTCLSVCGTHK